jgi:hypothetical protein
LIREFIPTVCGSAGINPAARRAVCGFTAGINPAARRAGSVGLELIRSSGIARRVLGFELVQALQDVVAIAVVHAEFEDAAGGLKAHVGRLFRAQQVAQGVDGVGGDSAQERRGGDERFVAGGLQALGEGGVLAAAAGGGQAHAGVLGGLLQGRAVEQGEEEFVVGVGVLLCVHCRSHKML